RAYRARLGRACREALDCGENFAGFAEVEGDLILERVGTVELALGADSLDQFELDAHPVDVAGEVEDVRLDRARVLRKSRPHPDVGDRSVGTVVEDHPRRINSVGRNA